jgi:hypothetical protein
LLELRFAPFQPAALFFLSSFPRRRESKGACSSNRFEEAPLDSRLRGNDGGKVARLFHASRVVQSVVEQLN